MLHNIQAKSIHHMCSYMVFYFLRRINWSGSKWPIVQPWTFILLCRERVIREAASFSSSVASLQHNSTDHCEVLSLIIIHTMMAWLTVVCMCAYNNYNQYMHTVPFFLCRLFALQLASLAERSPYQLHTAIVLGLR